jgi:CBS domain-containing protein
VRHVRRLPVVADGHVAGVITESDLFRLLIADTAGTESGGDGRAVLKCGHCGALLRRRTFETIGADDMCWRCHYHLHRCESCRYFDGIACMLDRPDRHTAVPGQHCQGFALLSQYVASRQT